MATTEFGAPIYTSEPEPEPTQQQNGGQAQVIDVNDPQLTSESLTAEDASQNAFSQPPPPPDGKWRAKLKIVDIKDEDGQMKQVRGARYDNMNDGKAFLVVNVEASLIDVTGKNDGIKATQYWVKSAMDRRKNVSEMTTITKAAGGAIAPPTAGERARYDALAKALAGEPEVIVETFWEASCQACQEKAKAKKGKAPRPFLLGMHRFPQSAGKPDPMVQCPTCHSSCRAQLRIGGFYNVKEMKATRGVA
jgi:hypothetical protein